jgi:hypothetical protein
MAEVQQSTQSGQMAQRFVQFVMIQAQNILFVLGKIPSPDGAVMPPNLQAAKMLIDQLEMIKEKTHGNLSSQESKILDDAIRSVQMAFVEASGGTPASMMPSRTPDMDLSQFEDESLAEDRHEEVQSQQPAPKEQQVKQPTASKQEPEEDKKKFFKSYG